MSYIIARIVLPLAFNPDADGRRERIPEDRFHTTAKELAERFGGCTRFEQARAEPREGYYRSTTGEIIVDETIELEVLFFASLVDRTGNPRERLTVEPDLDVGGLWELLVQRHPSLAQLDYRPMVALDEVFARWDSSLAGVHQVAFLPPVSGG